MSQQYPSALLEKAVGEFAKLPGIGKKTAMRLVLHLLRQDAQTVEAFGNAMITLKHEVKYCKVCHNISDTEVCKICSNPSRDSSTVCVVENIRDVMAVENTQQYKGLYHVLGGVISPMDGIGPSDLQIESLVERVKSGEVERSYSCTQFYHGRRYNQYLPETRPLRCKADNDCPRNFHRRRAGIYR